MRWKGSKAAMAGKCRFHSPTAADGPPTTGTGCTDTNGAAAECSSASETLQRRRSGHVTPHPKETAQATERSAQQTDHWECSVSRRAWRAGWRPHPERVFAVCAHLQLGQQVVSVGRLHVLADLRGGDLVPAWGPQAKRSASEKAVSQPRRQRKRQRKALSFYRRRSP